MTDAGNAIELVCYVEAADPLPDSAHVRISVLDVSRADAPAHEMCAQVVHPRDGRVDPVVVLLPADVTPSSGQYDVRVHVDVDGSGDVAPGDWVSTRSHPLSTSPGQSVHVPVSRV